MSRTTPALVGGIIEVDASIDLSPFIAAATVLVDDVAAAATTTLSSERLELIERWLAAHLYTVRDPRPTRQEAGSVAEQFQSAVALNLSSSHYGQTAMMLDSTGTLKALSASKGVRTISAQWLGNETDRGAVEDE